MVLAVSALFPGGLRFAGGRHWVLLRRVGVRRRSSRAEMLVQKCCLAGQGDPPWAKVPRGGPGEEIPPEAVPRQSGLSEGKFALPKPLCKVLGSRCCSEGTRRAPKGPCATAVFQRRFQWLCPGGSERQRVPRELRAAGLELDASPALPARDEAGR